MKRLVCPACDAMITTLMSGGPIVCAACISILIVTPGGVSLPDIAEWDRLHAQPYVQRGLYFARRAAGIR